MEKLVVLAHNIRSTYNVGSFFRSADGAGATKLVLSGYTPRPPHSGIAKVALGAETWFPWEHVAQPGPWLKRMKRRGYHVVALEQTPRSRNLFTFRPRFPMVLVVGNEVRGVSQPLLRYAETHLQIPMIGKKESLNVATAFGIAVYHLLHA